MSKLHALLLTLGILIGCAQASPANAPSPSFGPVPAATPSAPSPSPSLVTQPRPPLPIRLVSAIDAGVTDGERLAFARAGLTWNQVLGRDVFSHQPGPGTFVVLTHEEWTPNTLARALLLQQAGQAGEVRVNSKVDTASMLDAVMLHELGHILGIAHSIYPEDLMYPILWPGKTELTISDVACGQAALGAFW